MWHSACYKHSDGRLGCISCHDPHASPVEDARVDFYRSRCLTCHEERPCSTPEPVRRRTSAVDSCIECHMPPLSARDVPHTSQTDHRIRRHRDRPPPENEFREPRIVGARTDQLPQAEVDRAWGIWLGSLANDDAARAALERLSTIAALEGIDDETLLAAGTACRRLERNVEAERYWKRCLAANPESEAALFNLGQLYIAQRRWSEARDVWEKFLKVNPWFAEPYGRYAQVLEALGERDAAIAAARTGLERNPGLLPLRAWLAGACQTAGLEEEARMHRQIIEELATSGRMP
jgi:predicted Zn-dependent protease